MTKQSGYATKQTGYFWTKQLGLNTQLWKRGAACLKTASLADMADVIRTDGENWYVKEDDGEESWYPVQEPRMAAIYSMALERLGIE